MAYIENLHQNACRSLPIISANLNAALGNVHILNDVIGYN
jgi:hypothetical protein